MPYPKCEGRAHQSVLGVDAREGTMLAQHSRVTRLNHRPSRAPWIRGGVEAFCQGASRGGREGGEGWGKRGEKEEGEG